MTEPRAAAAGDGASSGSSLRRLAALVGRGARWLTNVPKLLLVGFLMLYRTVISPLYGPTCRFYPSCSQYALTAVQQHGALRGSWLAGRRLLRCHPWNPGGIDHVPPVRSRTPESRADRRVAPNDQNCAPSVPRRAA